MALLHLVRSLCWNHVIELVVEFTQTTHLVSLLTLVHHGKKFIFWYCFFLYITFLKFGIVGKGFMILSIPNVPGFMVSAKRTLWHHLLVDWDYLYTGPVVTTLSCMTMIWKGKCILIFLVVWSLFWIIISNLIHHFPVGGWDSICEVICLGLYVLGLKTSQSISFF